MPEVVQLHEQIRQSEPIIGRTALWGAQIQIEQLGVNDPLSHLKQYAEKGEAAITNIDEDLITDLGERMVKPRFVNEVSFDRQGDDFVSFHGRFSMREMTSNTEYKFGENIADLEQYKRAKVERSEVDRLNIWFDKAEPDDAFVVESLPLDAKERYSVVRIYRKVDGGKLQMYVFPLHNATVETFNQLHETVGANVAASQSPLELLDNMYAYRTNQDFENFLDSYIAAHDQMLEEKKPGEKYSFGLGMRERAKEQDDIAMIREQTGLRKMYHEAIKAIAHSGGKVTEQLLALRNRLDVRPELKEGSKLEFHQAQTMLEDIIQYIAATVNQASSSELKQLITTGSTIDVEMVARRFGMMARENGMHFGGACPTKRGGNLGEIDALDLAFGGDSDKLGKREFSCPSCGATNKRPINKTLPNCQHCGSDSVAC